MQKIEQFDHFLVTGDSDGEGRPTGAGSELALCFGAALAMVPPGLVRRVEKRIAAKHLGPGSRPHAIASHLGRFTRR
jgi:hypothetical protein